MNIKLTKQQFNLISKHLSANQLSRVILVG